MSDTTNNLALPYILPSQAQKHVTHNEALQRLDAIVQLCVEDEAANPPAEPVEGQCYLIGEGAGGVWTGKGGLLAFRQDGAWTYLEPRTGWRAFFAQLRQIRAFSGGVWRIVSLDTDGTVPMIGINATPDNVNRLSIASPASLFNHAGQGHQIKVNKASAPETGSLLFQTGWSGRAEVGLAGNDDFSIKVSSNGSDWHAALAISPAGIVEMPATPIARVALAPQTATPAPGGRTGFDDFHLLQGGFTFGPVVPAGTGHRLVVPASGFYLLLLTADTNSSSGHSAVIEVNGTTPLASTGGSVSATPARHTAFTLASLTAGDWLALLHSGSASYEFGAGKTELSVLML